MDVRGGGHGFVTCGRRGASSVRAMSTPAPRRRPLPQPRREAWSAALAPSQRRAAEARAALSRQRSALAWLRTIAPR